jgi:hypothetical protein
MCLWTLNRAVQQNNRTPFSDLVPCCREFRQVRSNPGEMRHKFRHRIPDFSRVDSRDDMRCRAGAVRLRRRKTLPGRQQCCPQCSRCCTCLTAMACMARKTCCSIWWRIRIDRVASAACRSNRSAFSEEICGGVVPETRHVMQQRILRQALLSFPGRISSAFFGKFISADIRSLPGRSIAAGSTPAGSCYCPGNVRGRTPRTFGMGQASEMPALSWNDVPWLP